jgi:hypothetical protein
METLLVKKHWHINANGMAFRVQKGTKLPIHQKEENRMLVYFDKHIIIWVDIVTINKYTSYAQDN